MYKVIIADDEPLVLVKERNTFDWEDYGFELIGETTSSTELIELIVKKKPDVVFVDINMPTISGLELISHMHKLKTKHLPIFVIISGYADFKHAQEAIRQGVFDYITKPFSKDDANTVLENLREHLDKKNGVFNDIDITSVKTEAFKNLIAYINEHYCEKLYLQMLADKFDINMTYCCYLFKKTFNLSFSQYILKCRMEKASSMLIDDNLSITEISEQLGYDYYHFNKVFKKYFQLTPKQYKFLNK